MMHPFIIRPQAETSKRRIDSYALTKLSITLSTWTFSLACEGKDMVSRKNNHGKINHANESVYLFGGKLNRGDFGQSIN